MPLYDFICTSCEHAFEEVRGSDEASPACPACNSVATERCMSAPGIKRNAPPFKLGPVRPMSPVRNAGPCGGGGCTGAAGGAAGSK